MKAFIGALLLVGLVLVYWQWVLAAVVVVLAVKAAPVAWRELQTERSAERTRLQALIARADEQHRWTMAGDDRGVYGCVRPTQIPGG